MINPALPLYVRLIGDGQFSSEQLIGYEFGYRAYFSKRGFVGISSFHNRYDDLLSVENRPPEPETDPSPTHLVLPLYFRNGVRATTSGVEIASLWDVRQWWRLRGSYSFMGLNAWNKPASNDLSTVRQLEGDSPAHKAVIQSSFSLPRKFELDLTWRYVSDLPDYRVPAYSTADIRFGRRIGEKSRRSLSSDATCSNRRTRNMAEIPDRWSGSRGAPTSK